MAILLSHISSTASKMNIFWLSVTVICIVLIWLYSKFIHNDIKNPFELDASVQKKIHVTDQKKRDAVLKNNFKPDKLPSQIDAIVIGSGIGGLTTAAILSKTGKKVLVLEQHDQAGGCCHTFIDKGYEFDVGIHYIGEMKSHNINKTLIDQISDGQIEWEPMSDDFDSVVFKDKSENSFKYYPITSDVEKQKKFLLKHFPEEGPAIEKFYDLVFQSANGHRKSMIVKFLPYWLVKILVQLGIVNMFISFFAMNERSVKDVVNELTENQTLRDIFCYCFGDYGTVPSKAGFSIQALLIHHFSKGACYPVGGASEIAHSIIPVIERSGGKVLVNAEVSEILLNSENKVRGVKVRHGKQEFEILSAVVISNAGLYNTFLRLLPNAAAEQSVLHPLLKRERGVGGFSVFVGFDASPEDMDIPEKKNFWVFSQNDIDQACVDYLKIPKEKLEDAEMPLMFVSFPSTKDPTWNKRYPGKSTMAIVSLSNYEWFEEWEKEPCQRRAEEYERLKKTIGWKLIDRAIEMFPKIKNNIDYVNVGSPLTNNFYLGSMKGEIYGLDHDMDRFSPLVHSLLRPKTDIPGLFLTGQDICSCGFVGGLWGGMLCAQQVLGRNVMMDLISLHKTIKQRAKKLQ